MTKDEILATVEEKWAGLQSAIARIPPERMAEPGVTGDWSVKDLLGHVAFWDRFSAEDARLTLAGEPRVSGYDWQRMNDENHAAKADWPAARVLDELAAAHAAMVAGWGALSTLDSNKINEDWEHYEEHGAEIQAWRERVGA